MNAEKLLSILDKKHIIFVGGKGGVGKTTSAAALAVHFAQQQRRTLIISTDPAHSLGDAFRLSLSHNVSPVMPYLDAIELDSAEVIRQHFEQIEATISTYTSPDMMPKMREFLRLSRSAPGAEEAAILEAICTHLLQARQAGYQHIIFDTAPTGHTLRLLTLPEMMQAWTDGLLSQQRRQAKLRHAADALDKKDISSPFQTASSDRWAKATEALNRRRQLFAEARELLHNAQKTAIVLVLIPEMLPLLETERAVNQLRAAQLPCTGLVVNNILSANQQSVFWQNRFERQQEILAKIQHTFREFPLLSVMLKDRDIRGVAELATMFDE